MDTALRRLGRVLLGIITVLLGIVALAGIAVVILTSTDWGHERVRRIALSQLQNMVHGRVSIGRLSGNLLTGLTAHNVAITDSTGAPFIAAQEVSARYALGPLIAKKIWLQDVRLVRPLIVLDRPPGGKWNYQRIFQSDTTKPASTAPGFGSWIRLENVTVVDGDLLVRTPWSPSASLSPATRDSVIQQALGGKSRAMVVHAPNAIGGAPPYQKVVELRSMNATLPLLQLADPSAANRIAEVASLQMTALPFRPPAAMVTDMRGRFLFNNDSLWWKGTRATMPGSRVSGDGSYAFSSGDMTLTLRGAPAALADLRWLYPRLPSEGGGTLDFAMRWKGSVQDYLARNADVRVGATTISGDFGLTMADTFALHDTNLRFANFDTRLAEQLIAGFKSPRRGTLTGRAALSGGKHALHVDADVAFADATTGTSQVAAVGEVGFGNGMRASNLHVRLHPVQVELAKAVAGNSVQLPISGVVTGTAVVTGDTKTRLVANLDLAHDDRGAHSQLTGAGALRLASGGGAPWMDVNVLAHPISLVEVGRFAPSVGLRGSAVGPVRLTGSLADLTVRSDLRLPDGGQLATRGTLGLTGPTKRYDVALGMKVFNLNAVLAKGPVTSLTLTASGQGAGFSPATMNARFSADVAASKWDSLALDSGSVRFAIANGLATVQKLQLSGATTLVDASGSFGLAPGRSGTLTYRVAVDSLGALDRLLPHTGPDTGTVLPRPAVIARAVRRARADSARIARRTEVERLATGRSLPTLVVDTPKATPNVLRGKLAAAGKLTGNLQRFDLSGAVRADSIDVHGNAARQIGGVYAWTNARTPASTMAIGIAGDSIMAAGFQFDSLDARLSYNGQQQGGRVALLVRQGDQRDYGVRGDYIVSPSLKQLRLADLELRFDTTMWRATHPATITSRPVGIQVQNLELRSGTTGRIYANGLLPSNGVGNLDVAIDNFQVGDLLDVLQSDLDLKGFVTLHGSMRGTLAAPTLRGALGLAGGVYKGDTVPDVRGTFDYARTALVTHLDLLHRGGVPMATVNANLPVNLALSGVTGSRLLQRPLTADLSADSLPLGLIPAFTGTVSDLHGVAAAQVAVRGTFNQPAITGGLLLKDATVRVSSTGMYLDNVNGALRMANDSVRIDSLTATAGRGRIGVNGGVVVRTWNDPRFSLFVVAHNAEVLHDQHGRLTADAGLRLTGPLARPYLSGQVQVTGGVLEFPNPTSHHVISAGDPDIFNVVDTSLMADKDLFPTESPILKNMRVEVTLGINRNTWVRTADANVEIFTDYPLEVHVARSALALTGAVSTERGDYTFLSKRFQITRGSATFVGTPDLNPTLQATGEYQVQLAGSPALDIQVMIGGTLKKPKLTLQSDAQPPKTQSELLTLLAFGEPANNLLQPEGSSLAGGGASGGLVGRGAQLAMTRLEGVAVGVLFEQVQVQAGRAIGADQFYITPGDAPELTTGTQGFTSFINSTRIEGGKYLNPRTFIGVQEYSLNPGVRLEYRTAKGWMYTAYTQPQVLLYAPTLETQPFHRKQSYGALIIRQWRF